MRKLLPIEVQKVLKQKNRTLQTKFQYLQNNFNALLFRGVHYETAIFSNCEYVLKRPLNRKEQLENEEKYRCDYFGLASPRKDYKAFKEYRNGRHSKHFPQTYLIIVNKIPLLVQEKCETDTNLYSLYFQRVVRLKKLTGVKDTHDANVGWRKPKNRKLPIPVIIDISVMNSDGTMKW